MDDGRYPHSPYQLSMESAALLTVSYTCADLLKVFIAQRPKGASCGCLCCLSHCIVVVLPSQFFVVAFLQCQCQCHCVEFAVAVIVDACCSLTLAAEFNCGSIACFVLGFNIMLSLIDFIMILFIFELLLSLSCSPCRADQNGGRVAETTPARVEHLVGFWSVVAYWEALRLIR